MARLSMYVRLWLLLPLTVVAARPYARQCQATLNVATAVIERLQSHYFNTSSGPGWSGGGWTDYNTVEDFGNYMLAAGSTEFDGVADQTRMGIQANTLSQDWNSFFSGFNDDAQWAILGYWKTADYKDAHGEDSTAYKNAALSVYQYVAAQYDTSLCGGGVPWTNGGNYKNAITNELFLTTSAQGYRRTGDQTFLDNAQKIWAWLEQSGIRNSDGLWNDGLDADTCQNNGETTWTYNQGVIASGLGYLGAITGNSTLFSQAELTLDATISKLTENGVLKEACDSPTSSSCGGDGQLFKGIWMKHVQFYLDAVNDASRTAKYSSFLAAQASAIETNALTSDNDIGSLWYTADEGGSLFGPVASASGLEALLSAAKYGTC